MIHKVAKTHLAVSDITALSLVLNKTPKLELDQLNWADFPYQPQVTASLLYNDDYLLVKYYVEEQELRLVNHIDQSRVCEDSCVEFFVSADDNGYFNFEFNAKGTCLAAFGKERAFRIFLSDDQMNQILRFPQETVQNHPNVVTWSIILAIPFSIIGTPPNKEYHANFYKCGDKHQVPHFLSWNPINTESPDFHKPECFGRIKLIP